MPGLGKLFTTGVESYSAYLAKDDQNGVAYPHSTKESIGLHAW